jgi:hypothetical protein
MPLARVERLAWLGNKELCKGKRSLLHWELLGGGGISSAKILQLTSRWSTPLTVDLTPFVLQPESRSSGRGGWWGWWDLERENFSDDVEMIDPLTVNPTPIVLRRSPVPQAAGGIGPGAIFCLRHGEVLEATPFVLSAMERCVAAGGQFLQAHFFSADVECVNPTPIVLMAMERCVTPGVEVRSYSFSRLTS